MEPLALLQSFVSAYGPAGHEDEVRSVLAERVQALDLQHDVDAKGNLLVQVGEGFPEIVVTAHLDEIALMVRQIHPDGHLSVAPLGGLHPWKLGEGAVDILTNSGPIPGVLGFGGIHTEDPNAASVLARSGSIKWNMASVFTGLSEEESRRAGIRPGSRVVVARTRRKLVRLGSHVAGYFLDDRADLVAWLLALEEARDRDVAVLFAATTEEEIGGLGALYLLEGIRPRVCVALELGANVPDAPVELSEVPTVWTSDGYAPTRQSDLELIDGVGRSLGLDLQFQALSRGGSDASCAASHGLCARPITLGLPLENSHGFEIIHEDSMTALGRLTAALLNRL